MMKTEDGLVLGLLGLGGLILLKSAKGQEVSFTPDSSGSAQPPRVPVPSSPIRTTHAIPFAFVISPEFAGHIATSGWEYGGQHTTGNLQQFLGTLLNEMTLRFHPINGDGFYTLPTLILVKNIPLQMIDRPPARYNIVIQNDPSAQFVITLMKDGLGNNFIMINLRSVPLDYFYNSFQRVYTMSHEFGHLYGLSDEYTCGANHLDQSECIMSSNPAGFGEQCYAYLKTVSLSDRLEFIAPHCGEKLHST